MTAAAARLAKVSAGLKVLDKRIVKVAAKAVHDAIDVQVVKDTGGDGRLSGYGAKAATLVVGEKPITNGIRLQPPGRGVYGQFLIVEAGADPHRVAAKGVKFTGKGAVAKRKAQAAARESGARGAFSGAKPLRTPWGPRYRLTRPVSSPAKRTWTKGVEAGRQDAVEAAREELAKILAG